MFPNNNVNSAVPVKKNGVWALVAGVVFIPLIFIAAFMGMFSGFLFDSPGSEKVWYVPIIFVWLVLVQPIMCLTASISGFVYHAKNKYGTESKINRLLIIVPAVYFLILAVLLIVLPVILPMFLGSYE